MSLKLVFVGGHQSGKSSIASVLTKRGFPQSYEPTIGIDTHKIRLETAEGDRWLWLWDVSHAELSGAHESLIYSDAHGIILVSDLTSYQSIQSIDEWLNSISAHLKNSIDASTAAANDDYDSDNDSNASDNESKTQITDSDSDLDSKSNTATTTDKTAEKSEKKRRKKKRKKDKPQIWVPRLYLLVSKYDLSDEPILTDIELHKFCKSNCIRAFARVSAKVDRRSEIKDIFNKFSDDIVAHLPAKTHNILQEETDRFRYYHAIKRMQRSKIKQSSLKSSNNTIFDVRMHAVRTFVWGEQTATNTPSDDDDDDDNDEDSATESRDSRRNTVSSTSPAQRQLLEVEQTAKRVLISMREAVRLQHNKTMRDAKINANKANDADSDEKSSAVMTVSTQGGSDMIAALKMEMLSGLEAEIDSLTKMWENELNTVAEQIRFQIPLSRVKADLDRLSQHIVAREMLFKRRLRLVHNLRSPAKSISM